MKNNRLLQSKIILTLVFTFYTLISFSQTTQTYTTSGSFIIPDGVTAVGVELWGAGAGGSNRAGAAGAGGGGAYTRAALTGLSSGSTMTVTVGVGGTIGTPTVAPGNFSRIVIGANTATANGGLSIANNRTGGNGGTAQVVGGIITVARAGGKGGNARAATTGGRNEAGGGGGGSATFAAVGGGGANGAGVVNTAVLGGIGQGNGGQGACPEDSNPDATAGIFPGGGGGGRGEGGGTSKSGANGQVILSWICPTYSLTSAPTATGPFCGVSSSVVSLYSNSLTTSGDYLITYDLSGATISSGNTAIMSFDATTDLGTFNTNTLNAGTTDITITSIASYLGGFEACSTTISSNNEVSVTIVDSPTAVAGTAITTCSTSGEINITAGSSATNYSEIEWTSSGTGIFNNEDSLTDCTYEPSLADIAAGSITLTLTAIGDVPCSNVTSNKTLTITQDMTANAGTAITTCSDSGAVNITAGSSATNQTSVNWTSSGTGDINNANSLTTCTYKPSPADIAAGNVTLTLTASNGGCADVIATKTLTINILPTANAGSDFTTCSSSGAINITAGSSASNYSGVFWTSSGTGTFTNETSLTTCTYTPSPADIVAGNVTLRLTANGNAPCGNVGSTKILTISQPMTANAGTTVITCSNSGAVNITAGSSATNQTSVNWTSSGTGSFANANSLTTCTYNPSPADITAGSVTLTLTASNGGCADVTATKTVTINALPIANAGTAITTCSNSGAVNITAGSSATNQTTVTWTSSGTGSFANENSLTTCTYNPSPADITAGSVTLTLTASNTGCSNVTATKTLTINALPTANAGTAITTCSNSGAINITAGSSATNYSSITWTSSGTGSFANDNSLTTCTYNPSAADITAGSVTITLTAYGNTSCGNVTATKTVTINTLPTANAGTAITTCSNSGAINITAGSIATNQTTVTWTSSGTGSFANANSLATCTYNPSAADITAGSITLTLTASVNGCSDITATKPLTINTLPTANAGTAVTTCSNSGAVNITAGSNATNYSSVIWTSSGTGSFSNVNSLTTCTYSPSVADITSGSVTLTLTAYGNTSCGNVTANKTLTISTLPTANAGTAITTCSNSGAINITAGSSATNQTSVTWTSSGTGSFSNANSLTTCTYNPSVADITAGSVTLTLTATNNGCTNVTATKTLTINSLPTANAGTAVTSCSNSGAVNITIGSSAINYSSITWTSSGTGSFTNANSLTTCTYNPSVADITSGSVTLTLTAYGNTSCGNVVANKTLTINSLPTAEAGSTITTCSNSGAINITSGSSATNYSSVTWTSSGTGSFTNANSLTTCTYNPSAADIAAGSVTLTLTTSNTSCADATDTRVLTILSSASATAGTDISTCSNSGAINITAGASVPSLTTVIWTSNGTGTFTDATSLTNCTYNPSVADIASGTIILTLTASNASCSVPTTKYLTITTLPTAIAGTNITTCSATGEINITAGSSANNQASVTWTSSGTGTFANPNSLTTCTYTPSPADKTAGNVTLTLTAYGNVPCGNVISTKSITISPLDTTISVGANQSTNTDAGLCTSSVLVPNVVFNDNCSTSTIAFTLTGATTLGSTSGQIGTYIFNKGITTINYTVTHYNGTTSTGSKTITVVDNINPTLTVGSNQSVNTDSGVCTASVAVADAVFGDNCSGSTLSYTLSGATTKALTAGQVGTYTFNKGVTTINYTVTDSSTLTTTGSKTITVTDNSSPTLTAGANQSVNTDSGVCNASVIVTDAVFGDNCPGSTLTYTLSGATTRALTSGQVGTYTFNLGITTINYTVTDSSNLTSTGSKTITITDITAPTLTVGSNQSANTDSGVCTASVAVANATFGDNCSGATITYSLSGATTKALTTGQVGTYTFNLGITTINYTVTDSSNNTTTGFKTITISDITLPTLSAGSNQSANTDSGLCTASVSVTNATFGDNCTVTISYTLSGATTKSLTAGQVGTYTFNKGITTINYTVTDAASNTTTGTKTITINDTIAPSLTAGANQTASTDAGVCTASVVVTDATFSDNCTVGTIAYTLTGATTKTLTAGQVGTYTFNKGITTINYTVTDAASNTTTGTKTITVNDNEKPVVATPNSIPLQCAADIPTAVTTIAAFLALPGASATDNCTATASLTVTSSTVTTIAGSCGGIIIRTYTVTDANTNFQSVNQIFTINDTTKPIVTAPTSINLECSSDLPAAATTSTAFNALLGASATDNCTPTASLIVTSVTATLVGFSYFGSISRTYTVKDLCGNQTIVNQIFTINDTTKPIAKCKNVSVTLDSSGSASISISQINNTSTDNCGIASVTASKLLFNCGNVGTNSVTLTVTDNNNNIDTCIATVTVTDPAASATVSISASPSTAICQGTNVTFTATPVNPGTNPHYQWYKNGIAVGTDSPTYSDSSLSNGNSIYVELRSGVCNAYSTSNTFTAVVNPLPIVTSPASICKGFTKTLSPTTGGTWISNNPAIATVTNAGAVTGVIAGTTTFKFTISTTGCSSTTSAVTIYNLPVVTAPSEICINETKVLSPTTGGVWTSSNMSVATVTNAGVITGKTVGTTTFTFTDSTSGCSSTTTSVSALALPVITSVLASPTTVCSGDQSSLDAIVQGATNTKSTIVNYDFNSGTSYSTLVSNAITGITSTASGTSSFSITPTGKATSAGAFTTNSTAGKSLYLEINKPTTFSLGGTDLSNYTTFNVYFQANRETSSKTKTITVTYSKNGDAFSTAFSVTLTKNNTWYTGTFTLPSGASNPNSLDIALTSTGTSSEKVKIDNFQVEATKLGATFLYSWTASPAETGGLPENAEIPSLSNKSIPVNPTVTTVYTLTATNSNGCQATKNVTVAVYPDPDLRIAVNFCYGINNVEVKAISNNGVALTFLWNTGATTQSIFIDTAQTVQVIATTSQGCEYVKTISIAEELITNGNFSDGNTGFSSDYAYKEDLPGLVPAGKGELYDDSGNNGYSITTNGQNVHINFWGKDHTNNSTGSRNFMTINGHGSTLQIWKQTVATIPGNIYYFSAYAMSINSAGNYAKLRFSVNGTQVGTTATLAAHANTNNDSDDNWTRFYGTWTAPAGVYLADVEIVNLVSFLSGNDFAIDDISFGTFSPFLFLTSPVGTDSQSVCEGSAISNIIYSVGHGITAPIVTGLPAGISNSYNGFTLSFSGTPTVAPGTYNYTITTTGTCGAPLVTIGFIKVDDAAEVDAGPDITICSSTAFVNMNATLGGGASSGSWSGGTGTFSNNLPNAKYTLGAGDSGTVTLMYTTNDPSGPCPSVSDTLKLIIIPFIASNAGTVTTSSNCSNTTITLGANGTIGQWAVTSGQTASTYSFSNSTSPTSTFTGESGETYTLSWTVQNTLPCLPSTSTVSFTFANCLNICFDGVDDNVKYTNNFNLNSSFSFEIWAKPNAINGFDKTLLSKKDVNNLNIGYDLRLVNNTISFYSNNSKVVSASGINSNRWYHIAVTFNGSTYKLYFDGIEMNSAIGTVPTTNTANFLIGAMFNSLGNPVKYYEGWLDELRIWNVALTKEQIRQMMNQEIEKNEVNVQGSIIPLTIDGLVWTNLSGYYQMNQGTSDVANGNLNETGFISGRLLNMTQSQEQTAPLPYTTRVNNQDWTTDNTWTNYPVWNYPNSLGVNGDPIDWNIVKLSHNINSGDKDITLLGLLSDTGTLSMKDPQTTTPIESNDGQNLWITHYLKLNGSIDLVGESQLIQKRYTSTQVNESVLDATSTGYIERDQQGKKNSFNYNYWSSPVCTRGGTNNSPYSISSILKDGTESSNPKTIMFGDGPYFADGPISSPIKISNRWIWAYNKSILESDTELDKYFKWEYKGSTGQLKVGEGFTMKGTGGSAAIGATQNYVFVGKPNNGDVLLPLPLAQSYLVGNPYPSAIDANEFILDNLAGRAGVNVFNGALYFWDHFEVSNSHILNEYQGGYATYNLIGGVTAINNSVLTLNDESKGNNRPKQFIPIGQGFFVDAFLDPSLSNLTTVSGGTLIFKNSQRSFAKESPANSNFMRTSGTMKTQTITTDIKPKIRLGFDSSIGTHRQLLVGSDPNATNSFDLGFDAPMFDTNENDMYWLISDRQFVIQGVPDFNENQIIPLGIVTAIAGEVTIKIDELENIPSNTNIYLYDNQKDVYHDLINSDFKITLLIGSFNNRFSLRFEKKETLSIEEKDFNTGIIVFYSNQTLNINNYNLDSTVKTVTLFNILGQKIENCNVADREQTNIRIPIKNLSAGTYIAKIKTSNGNTSKKFIIN